MNSPRFDRFAQPHFLHRIGRKLLTQMLSPFAPELLAHGMALPATSLPDDLFFVLLSMLPRQAAGLSAGLLEAMMAIEVVEEILPDEVPAAPCPLVVSELRLRLGAQQRPILLQAGPSGLAPASGRMEGAVADLEPCFVVVAETRPSGTLHNSWGHLPHHLHGHRSASDPTPGGAKAARFKFRQKGSVCVVRFDGGERFHLANTDGAKYLDHLLHHPNEVIRAFDLERAVKPDKAAAREANSIQRAVDGRTLREAREELLELEAELATAEAEGLTEKCERLGLEIAQIKKFAGKTKLLTSDTGERARNNVRKAIGKVIAKLRKAGAAEQAFALHLTQSVSLGYDVVYTQPAGKIWS